MEVNFANKSYSVEEARRLSPLVLAFIGDGIYEIMVRTFLVDNNQDMSVHKLHLRTISFVKAHAQSDYVKKLENEFTEEEIQIYKRGRNAKSPTVPKNADVQEYRAATGFEALFGYLYLTTQRDRLLYFFQKIVQFNKEVKVLNGL